MKKIFHLFVLLSFLSTGLTATASETVNGARSVVSEEPEPHPNTIYVKLKLNGNTVYLSVLVFPGDLVGDVKSSVSEITGIPASNFSLYFNGQALDEDLTLAYYGIGAGATLNAY